MKETKELILYVTQDQEVTIEVSMDGETVWLNRNQMADLFERDVKTIGKHINNAINEELSGLPTVAKFATVQQEGKRKVSRMIEHYNLDVIISVGYRVKSQRGVEFRRWANDIIKEYVVRGYVINHQRMKQLNQVVQIMKRINHQVEAKQILDVIEQYLVALNMLDDYDHQRVLKPEGNKTVYRITYEECTSIINKMGYGSTSPLFGKEKDKSFQSSIAAIYQTFNGEELYSTVEEKSAQLLYFIIKNHSFVDGNKRIAAAIFLYFLDRNQRLFLNGKKAIDDYTLVAVTIMIAESRPEEKEMMINLVMNFLNPSETISNMSIEI